MTRLLSSETPVAPLASQIRPVFLAYLSILPLTIATDELAVAFGAASSQTIVRAVLAVAFVAVYAWGHRLTRRAAGTILVGAAAAMIAALVIASRI